MATTIEEKVAGTILQKDIEVTVGGKKYKAAPASTATLILASEAVSRLPKVNLNPEKVVEESLSVARECRPLGDIAAILILGAKDLTETVKARQTVEKRRLWGLVKWTEETEVEQVIDRKAELAKKLLEDLSPRALNLLVAQLLQKMELGDFFGLTTFLTEINLMRPTKVGNETTASGQ